MQNSKLVCLKFKNTKKRYTGGFPPVYGTLNENQLLRAQQNQEGNTDISFTVTVYLFLAKNTMSLFRTAKQRYTVDFTPVYGTLNENQLLRAQQNQEGDTDLPFTVTVYRFIAKNAMSLLILSEFLTTYLVCFY